jgi:hypothetical protein
MYVNVHVYRRSYQLAMPARKPVTYIRAFANCRYGAALSAMFKLLLPVQTKPPVYLPAATTINEYLIPSCPSAHSPCSHIDIALLFSTFDFLWQTSSLWVQVSRSVLRTLVNHRYQDTMYGGLMVVSWMGVRLQQPPSKEDIARLAVHIDN